MTKAGEGIEARASAFSPSRALISFFETFSSTSIAATGNPEMMPLITVSMSESERESLFHIFLLRRNFERNEKSIILVITIIGKRVAITTFLTARREESTHPETLSGNIKNIRADSVKRSVDTG